MKRYFVLLLTGENFVESVIMEKAKKLLKEEIFVITLFQEEISTHIIYNVNLRLYKFYGVYAFYLLYFYKDF